MIRLKNISPLFDDEAEILTWVAQLREDRTFLERLRNAAQAAEPIYPPSVHIEEQLYGGAFPSLEDKNLMLRFHTVPWKERAELARQLSDARYRRLAYDSSILKGLVC